MLDMLIAELCTMLILQIHMCNTVFDFNKTRHVFIFLFRVALGNCFRVTNGFTRVFTGNVCIYLHAFTTKNSVLSVVFTPLVFTAESQHCHKHVDRLRATISIVLLSVSSLLKLYKSWTLDFSLCVMYFRRVCRRNDTPDLSHFPAQGSFNLISTKCWLMTFLKWLIQLHFCCPLLQPSGTLLFLVLCEISSTSTEFWGYDESLGLTGNKCCSVTKTIF
jgi:hypothetical protein